MARPRNVFREAHRIYEMIQNGPGVARIEIHITIIPGTSDQAARDDGAVNDLDQELQEFQARHGQKLS